jgi:lipid II:glycine glycyltransferase (peptidoglycan interpeptide bridge formation enzyme)
VESIPGASFMQSSPWARVKSLSNWKPLRVVLFRENRIVGGAQILLKPIPLLGYLGYLTYGPLAENDSNTRNAVIQAVTSAARQHRVRYLLTQPPEFVWHDALTQSGFLADSPASSTIIDTTLILDLAPEPRLCWRICESPPAMKFAPGFEAGFGCGLADSRILMLSSL